MLLSFTSTSEMVLQPLTRMRTLMGILIITRGKSKPANTCQIPKPIIGTAAETKQNPQLCMSEWQLYTNNNVTVLESRQSRSPHTVFRQQLFHDSCLSSFPPQHNHHYTLDHVPSLGNQDYQYILIVMVLQLQ